MRSLFTVLFLVSLVCLNPVQHARASEDPGWFVFDPAPDPFTNSPIDLRFLNESSAGHGGFIAARDGKFIHSKTGYPIRFWGVNGPPGEAKDRASIRQVARTLAKRGVNLVRVHTPIFRDTGEPDPDKIKRAHVIVEEMKAEGIYTLFSIYFPLWLRPAPDTPWLEGYDGSQHPFAALFFNPDFQAKYRDWWRALLLTPSVSTGRTILEEPAVAGLEILNEDSFFFWTFAAERIPERQRLLLESQFARWLVQQHGSLETALNTWNGLRLERDAPADGRIAFRPLWNLFNEKTARDMDTTRFLFETQTEFYSATFQFLRSLGFKGVITTSNWTTASPDILGPLEKFSYTVGDFMDRHGYFSCNHKGENSAWSIRSGHSYSDRSALRFDPEEPGKPRLFVHPAMDVHYDSKPSMISETTWTRPNRYRSEAPLFYAAYGALQDSDAIVHFALDGSRWTVKPGFFMQPWSLMSPAMIGQFPAAALIYRKGLIDPGPVVASLRLNTNDLFQLKGTPLPQDAAFDELRLQDLPDGVELKPGQRVDPLLHYVGRSHVHFTGQPGAIDLRDLTPFIDRERHQVSSATGELNLNYALGLLTINSPKAQGVSGNLKAAGLVQLRDLEIRSELDLGHIIAVALDDLPLNASRRILLQVMSEEQPTGWKTEPLSTNVHRIVDLGSDPWLVRELNGSVRLNRPDATTFTVTALDHNGYPIQTLPPEKLIHLLPTVTHYVLSAPPP